MCKSCIVIAGLDLQSLASEIVSGAGEDADIGRKAMHLRNIVSKFQDSFNVIEKVMRFMLCIFWLALKCINSRNSSDLNIFYCATSNTMFITIVLH